MQVLVEDRGFCEEQSKEYAEDVVQSLIKSGISDEIIQQATKLSLEEIVALREKLSSENEL